MCGGRGGTEKTARFHEFLEDPSLADLGQFLRIETYDLRCGWMNSCLLPGDRVSTLVRLQPLHCKDCTAPSFGSFDPFSSQASPGTFQVPKSRGHGVGRGKLMGLGPPSREGICLSCLFRDQHQGQAMSGSGRAICIYPEGSNQP